MAEGWAPHAGRGSSGLAAPGPARGTQQGAFLGRLRLPVLSCPRRGHPAPPGSNEAAAHTDHPPGVHHYRSLSGLSPSLPWPRASLLGCMPSCTPRGNRRSLSLMGEAARFSGRPAAGGTFPPPLVSYFPSAQTTSGATRAWRQTPTSHQAGGKSVTLWAPTTGMCQLERRSGSTPHAPAPAQEGARRLMERRHSREW